MDMNLRSLISTLQQCAAVNLWCVSDDQLRLFYPDEAQNTFYVALSRHVRAGAMQRLVPGLYRNPYLPKPRFALEWLACLLRPFDAFYLSLETALHEYGRISQIPNRLTFMTSGTSRTFITALGTIEFTHTQRPIETWRSKARFDATRSFYVASEDLALHDLKHVGRCLDLVSYDRFERTP
jgi:hypothetical protein